MSLMENVALIRASMEKAKAGVQATASVVISRFEAKIAAKLAQIQTEADIDVERLVKVEAERKRVEDEARRPARRRRKASGRTQRVAVKKMEEPNEREKRAAEAGTRRAANARAKEAAEMETQRAAEAKAQEDAEMETQRTAEARAKEAAETETQRTAEAKAQEAAEYADAESRRAAAELERVAAVPKATAEHGVSLFSRLDGVQLGPCNIPTVASRQETLKRKHAESEAEDDEGDEDRAGDTWCTRVGVSEAKRCVDSGEETSCCVELGDGPGSASDMFLSQDAEESYPTTVRHVANRAETSTVACPSRVKVGLKRVPVHIQDASIKKPVGSVPQMSRERFERLHNLYLGLSLDDPVRAALAPIVAEHTSRS